MQRRTHFLPNGHQGPSPHLQLVVPEDKSTSTGGVISLFHDSTTAGHLKNPFRQTGHRKRFRWPTFQNHVRKDYVKGCAICQSTKPRTMTAKTTIKHLSHREYYHSNHSTRTSLRNSQVQENDTILTITDHDCSKATLFFPCSETITAEDGDTICQTCVPRLWHKYRKVLDHPCRRDEFYHQPMQTTGIKQNSSSIPPSKQMDNLTPSKPVGWNNTKIPEMTPKRIGRTGSHSAQFVQTNTDERTYQASPFNFY